ncbi:MAG: esterase [Candidatus Saccharibacteria bacterium]|nr:esterase [Candidatus Saccharibacteria bacterium]
MTVSEYLKYRVLRRPLRLHRGTDTGKGPLVVLLHGIGQSHVVWQPLVPMFSRDNCRVVGFDLLGFGESPIPDWLDYTVDDHVDALLASIKKLRPTQPIILVGHSMGCLIAVRLAYRRPDLVKHLVLYEMPIYEGLPNKRRYRWRVDAYRTLYDQISAMQPVAKGKQGLAQALVQKVTGQQIDAASWQPYVKSLKNTIVKQNAAAEIVQLKMPIDVLFGRRDMLVIRGKVQQIFGTDTGHISAHTIRERHRVTQRASLFIYERVRAALKAGQTSTGHSRLKDLLS